MGTRGWMAACAAAMAFAFAGQAGAAVYTVTFAGTVESGSIGLTSYSGMDGSGLFGGGSLVGDPFTATYTFDTSLGSLFTAPGTVLNYGGGGFGDTSPITSAELTINGITQSFLSPWWDQAEVVRNLEGSLYAAESDNADYTSKFDVAWSSTGGVTGDFLSGGTSGLLEATAASVSPDISVPLPEPETWALLLLGVAAIGASARSERADPARPVRA